MAKCKMSSLSLSLFLVALFMVAGFAHAAINNGAPPAEIIVTEPVVIDLPPTATSSQNVSTLANFLVTIAVIVLPIVIISALPIVFIVVVAIIIWRLWKKWKRPW